MQRKMASEVNERRLVDLTSIGRVVMSRVARKYIGKETFSLSDLESVSEFGTNELIHFRDLGMLNPLPSKKGERDVELFTTKDIENLEFASELMKLGYAKRKKEVVSELVLAWRGTAWNATDEVAVDQRERARSLLLAHLLGIELALIGETSETLSRAIFTQKS